MLLSHLIVIILVIIVFCFIVQYASNLYIYRKLHNQGADIKTAKNTPFFILINMNKKAI